MSICMDREKFCIVALFLFSLLINFWNLDFPCEHHADEPKKVRFVQQGTQDFKHPIAILQFSRFMNIFIQTNEKQDIVLIGRSVSAISGAFLVVFSYLLVKNHLRLKFPLIYGLCLATSPIIALHTHYFKEDILFVCFLYLSIFLYFSFLNSPNTKKAILLGIAIGLSISTKYVGILSSLLIFLSAICSFRYRNSIIIKYLCLSLITSVFVFTLVNYPMFANRQVFLEGLSFEIHHVIQGHHSVSIHFSDFWGTFHLTHSLFPGLTPFIAIPALCYMFYEICSSKGLSFKERFLIIFALSFYFTAEISPSKPFPDYMRYMIPIVPIMIFYACKCMEKVSSITPLVHGLVVIATSYAFYETVQIVRLLKSDVRNIAEDWVLNNGEDVRREWYTCYKSITELPFSVALLSLEDERKKGVKYFIASSFIYDRIHFASKLKYPSKEVLEMEKQYQTLFSLPYVELKPAYKSFGFSNPTIRIIDIQNAPLGSQLPFNP